MDSVNYWAHRKVQALVVKLERLIHAGVLL